MNRLERAAAWYTGWIVQPDDDVASKVLERRRVISQLVEAIQRQQYDPQTFAELTQLLDHERLCLEITKGSKFPVNGQRAFCIPALTPQSIEAIFGHVSECMVRPVNVPSDLERELQGRVLVSALLLLHAHSNAEQPQDATIRRLRNAFNVLFQELRMHPTASDSLTAEKFRTLQSSYILSFGFERAIVVGTTLPTDIAALLKQIYFETCGTCLIMPVNNDPGAVPTSIEKLSETLEDMWQDSGKEAETDALFGLHDLIQITRALQLLAGVAAKTSAPSRLRQPTASAAVPSWQRFALTILDKVLNLMSQCQARREVDTTPTVRQSLSQVLDLDKPQLEFLYLWGLLDCASDLSGILKFDALPRDLNVWVTRSIIAKEEPLYRLKAMEILLSDPDARESNFQALSTLSPKPTLPGNQNMDTPLNSELLIVRHLLNEEHGHYAENRRSSRVTASSSASSNEDLEYKFSVEDWTEERIPSSEIGWELEEIAIKLGKPSSRFHRSPRYNSFGLSPNCETGFLSTSRSISIYSLRDIKRGESVLIANINSLEGELTKAVLSNRFLAVVNRTELFVYGYNQDTNPTTQLIGRERFESSSKLNPWDPNCLAIHETIDRTWIAVGGRSRRKETFCAEIKTYQVSISASRLELFRHPVHFPRGESDPLHDDFLRMIEFGPDGASLVCVTNNHKILVWPLSNNARPRQAPFKISRKYAVEMNSRGVTCAAPFRSWTGNSYVFCTTSPSNERAKYGGEWSFLSPVAPRAASVPKRLTHNIEYLQKAAIVGAASPFGDLIAVVEKSGRLKVLQLENQHPGGLCCPNHPLDLAHRLCEQNEASATSLRFCQSDTGVSLFAIDCEGTVVRKDIRILYHQMPASNGVFPLGAPTVNFGPSELASHTQQVAELESREIMRLAGPMASNEWAEDALNAIFTGGRRDA